MTELYGLGYLRGGYAPLTEDEAPVLAPPGSAPDLRLLVDFVHDVNPQSTPPEPTWTDLTAIIRSPEGFTFSRGRQRTLDRNEAGTFSVLLDDPDGVLDPQNDSSPLFPNVVPMRRFRLEGLTESTFDAFVTGTSALGDDDYVGGGEGQIATAIMDGVIERYDYAYPGRGIDGTVLVRGVDWLGALARTRFSDTLDSTVAYNMIAKVLDEAEFTTRRDLGSVTDPGMTVQTQTYDDAPMLDAIQQVAFADAGNFFSSRDGVFTYRHESWQYRPVSDSTLTIAHGTQEFVDVTFLQDDTTLYNDVTIAWSEGQDEALDQSSIDRFFRRPLSLTLPLVDQSAVLVRLERLLDRYSLPHRIISRLDISNVVNDWRRVFALELWDPVIVRVRLTNGDVVEQISLVEGIDVSAPSQQDWRYVLWLSPAPFTNVLTDEQRYFETGITGWNAETNCTIAQSAASSLVWTHSQGSYGLFIEATTDGDVSVRTDSMAIEPRATYVAALNLSQFTLETFSTPLTGHIEIEWRDSADALLSTVIGDDVIVTTSFRRPTLSARSPAAAAYIRLRAVVEDLPDPSGSFGLEEGAYIDEADIHRVA